MADLITETPEASAWVRREKAARANQDVFERFAGAVIWLDEPGANHEAIGGTDPAALIAEINQRGQPMFLGHDPGAPVGRVFAAGEFVDPRGVRFVAAVMGYYGEKQRLRFEQFGVDPTLPVDSPSVLSGLPTDPWLDIATDPREVDSQWLKELLEDPPYRVKSRRLSHNAAETVHELIRVGFPYVLLAWNPLAKTIGEEVGKKLCAAAFQWLRKLWTKLQERQDPIVVLESFQDGCEVSFNFRGKDVKRNYAAHDALSAGAAQAARLIRGIKANGRQPTSLVYEFDVDATRWFPAYAILEDGRIVKDRPFLIAVEQLPTTLSLGLSLDDDKPTK